MPESVATLAPSGAGRFQDWIWPGRLTAAGAPGFDTTVTSRHGSVNQTGSSTGVGATTTPFADVKLGVPAVAMPSTGAGGIGFAFGQLPMLFRTQRGVPINGQVDDQQVYRVVWIFAGSGAAANAGQDNGLEFCQFVGTTGFILKDANAGFGFRLAGANVLEFIARGPNGLVTTPFTAAPFDASVWHSLDLRISSATASADAGLELRLDDVPVNLGAANSSWAAGTNLPPLHLLGNAVGFKPTLIANAGNVQNHWTYQLRFITAPSIRATL